MHKIFSNVYIPKCVELLIHFGSSLSIPRLNTAARSKSILDSCRMSIWICSNRNIKYY